MGTNVKFLKGPQANFDSISSYTAGAFYLTTDTDRLYFAQSANEVVYLNKYIVTFNSEADFKSAAQQKKIYPGDLVFIQGLNALVYVTADDSYIQLNKQLPDTNTDTQISKVEFSEGTVANNIVSYNLTLTKEKKNEVTDQVESTTTVIGKLNVEREDIANILELSMTSAVLDRNVTVNLLSDEKQIATTTFALPEDKNTFIDEIKTEWGTVADGKASLTVTAGRNDDQDIFDSVNIVAGKDIALSSSSDADNLTINHKTYSVSKPAATKATVNLDGSGKINAITSLAIENGHVTTINTTEFALPEDKYVESGEFKWGAVSENKAALNLTLTRTDDESIIDKAEIKGGTDIVLTADSTNDVLTVAHKTYSAVTPEQASVNKQGNIVAVTGLTLENGHVTGINTANFVDTHVTGISHGYNVNEKKLTTTITQNDDTTKSDSVNLYVKINNTDYALNSSLDAGIEGIVNAKLVGANAMVYKGAVSTLPTANLANGNTYLVTGAGFTVNGESAKAGDMIVYADPDGDGNGSWTLIPSANEVDTTYEFKVENDSAGANIVVKGSDDKSTTISLEEGDSWIGIAGDSTGKKITFIHEAPGTGKAVTASKESTAQTPGYEGSVTVVVGAMADDKGHITDLKTQDIKLPAEHEYSLAGNIANNAVELRKDSDEKVGSIAIVDGDSIDVVATKNTDGDEVTFTVSHSGPLAASSTVGASTGASPALFDSVTANRQFKAIGEVKYDKNGHIVSVAEKTITLPDLAVNVDEKNKAINFLEGDENVEVVKFINGNKINVVADATNQTFTINHDTIGTVEKTDERLGSVDYNTDFKVIDEIGYDNYGHISKISTKTVTMPNEKVYTFTTGVAASGNVATITDTLKKDDAIVGSAQVYSIGSESLVIAASNNAITMNLEWGSF